MTSTFIDIIPGMRVKWKPKQNPTEGTILTICLDIENPKRMGIEAEIRWDDGQVMRYNAVDFGNEGDIEILQSNQ